MRKLATLILTIFVFALANVNAQTVIGLFPQMDGGFEGQNPGTIATLSSIGNGVQRTDWTVSAGSGSALINSASGRSGSKYLTAGATSSTARRFQSPTSANGAILNATGYTIQFYYRTSGATAITNGQANASPDGTGFPGTYQALALSGTSSAWTKVQQTVTTGTSANATKYGISIFRLNGASGGDVDIDDWVMYAGAADNTAPNSPGTVTTANPSPNSLDVSWGAASGGVDGGGYVVVRYAVSPNADNDPNQNGIYAVGNTISNGTVNLLGTIRYIGTNTSFTDNIGLLSSQTYYYKVYTVDKAFNYSNESEGNGTTAPPVSPTLTLNSGITDFGNVCINTTAGPNSFTISGSNLDGTNIVLGALAGYSYSETVGGPYTGTLSFSYTGASFTNKIIYTQFTPTAEQSYNGNITVNGGGVSGFNVPVTGVGINKASVTTGGNSITGLSATLNAVINYVGCNPITAYGFAYSTTSSFPDGDGTQINSSNLSGSNYSAVLSNLDANKRYYYKAFVTTASGTSYGTQQAFNAPPVPVIMSAQPSLTYTETFADIANWGNFFVGGTGSEHFSQATGSTGTIPAPTNVTTTTVFSNGVSGGVQRGTDQVAPSSPRQSIVLLSTGTSDNTTSAAFDFYMDFTGVNAGTLSFDYEVLFNGTATDNRNGSLRVYATTDGISYTEIANTAVLNFTNNVSFSGSKTNITLPAIFDNSPTARLRFYYYNGTGGSSGSRPKISLDNLSVTALATTPCSAPTAPATSLVFGTATDVSIAGSFTAPNPTTDQYLVIASTNNSLVSNPVDGQVYALGDNVGDGTVVAKGSSTSFTATGLSASTTYYFFVFPVNAICTGGPLYHTANVLSAPATTTAGLPACSAPSTQPTTLTFGTTTTNSVQGSFTGTTTDEYLVIRSTSPTLSLDPVNAQVYNAGETLGNGVVVQRSNSSSFTATGLAPNTTYYFFVYSLNSQGCVNGPVYNTSSPLTGSQATMPLPPCVTPASQPTSLNLTAANTAIAGNFVPVSDADTYLIVRSTSSSLSASPADGTIYNVGDNLGGGIVVANSSNNVFQTTGLTPGTTYYFFVFAADENCSGGPKYLTTSPLTGSSVTLNTPTFNYYFGTLHSHSDYSDGNQDHPGYTPTDDYNYAMTAQCMDYLGISEHNHFSSPDNPGNKISTYHQGITEAQNFSASHPSFLALYGMEWGVISGGGHVVVYGDGMNELFGWESGSGQWGPTNNYDVYVAKSDYTGTNGLFKTITDRLDKNTFGSLAHPNLTDYNNLANSPYDLVADNAITATAVESGPSSSTATNYSNPGSSMSYLWYYQTLLSKGYHLGPVIDHDNHKTTFGKTTYSRTAIVAPSLSQSGIVSAMRNMSFYATQDCDTKVEFMLNTRMMGSVFTDQYAPVISVLLTDGTTSVANAKVRLFYGQPGSGILPVQIDSAVGASVSFTHNGLANGATGYYYIDITNGSSRIVTAPVWYTRNDNNSTPLPVKLRSFTATKEASSVKLVWATSQEVNAKDFVLERSTDGVSFRNIGTVAARGNSSVSTNYSFVDAQPAPGNNYYRLKLVDNDNKFKYSNVVKINFAKAFNVSVSPNPATNYVVVGVSGAQLPVIMEMMNASGKMIKTLTLANGTNRVSISGLAKGLYLLKFSGANDSYTEKLIVQ